MENKKIVVLWNYITEKQNIPVYTIFLLMHLGLINSHIFTAPLFWTISIISIIDIGTTIILLRALYLWIKFIKND